MTKEPHHSRSVEIGRWFDDNADRMAYWLRLRHWYSRLKMGFPGLLPIELQL